MCGIAGIVDRREPTDKTTLLRMLATLRHRGPDGSGTFHDRDVSLGHCRLAVLDPSPAGRQPMVDASGRFVCTYNGAIYNFLELRRVLEKDGYRFRSTGDTEVLLAAYATLGRRLSRPSERHVRVRGLRPVLTGAVLRPRPVRGQAVRLRLRRPAIRLRLRAQGADHSGPGDATCVARRHLRIRRPRLCLRGRQSVRGHPVAPARSRAPHRRRPPARGSGSGGDRAANRPSATALPKPRSYGNCWPTRRACDYAATFRSAPTCPAGSTPARSSAAAALGGAGQLVTFTGAFAKPARADERKWSRLVADGARLAPGRDRARRRRAGRGVPSSRLASRRAGRRSGCAAAATRLRQHCPGRHQGGPQRPRRRRTVRRIPSTPGPAFPTAAPRRPRSPATGGRGGRALSAGSWRRPAPHPTTVGAGHRSPSGLPGVGRSSSARAGPSAVQRVHVSRGIDALGPAALPSGSSPCRGPHQHGVVGRIPCTTARSSTRRLRHPSSRSLPFPAGNEQASPARRG